MIDDDCGIMRGHIFACSAPNLRLAAVPPQPNWEIHSAPQGCEQGGNGTERRERERGGMAGTGMFGEERGDIQKKFRIHE